MLGCRTWRLDVTSAVEAGGGSGGGSVVSLTALHTHFLGQLLLLLSVSSRPTEGTGDGGSGGDDEATVTALRGGLGGGRVLPPWQRLFLPASDGRLLAVIDMRLGMVV